MAFEVIPFCRIVKFSGITRFLYQFWKILPKYCGRKEKDHNILWSKWYSRRESNPQRPLRRGLLYPFNYGSVLNFIARGRNHCRKKFYTKIYTSFFPPRENKHKSSGFARKTCVLGNILWIEQYLRRGLLYPFNYGSIFYYPAREYFVAALLVPPQAVGRTRNDLLCLYAEAYFIIPPKYVAALGTLFILQRFAQKGNCFRGGSLKVPPRCPDRGFCRKISFKHLTMRREYV